MNKGTRKTTDAGAQAREDRLKAALKANLARRKAQARARAEPTEPKDADPSGDKA
ncbi:hypothetical protein [Sagittula sp. SSi028]|uniref:hypothetical protein n=1 Tax=Sagittula sp. SSi028 TaxID=3400636 RepID=UPI003AF61AFE